MQKTLDEGNGPGEPEDVVSYPTGEVPGRGDCQLIEHMGVDKATYNAFTVRSLHLYFSRCVHCPDTSQRSIHESTIAAGIPKTSLWKDVPHAALGEVLDVVSSFPHARFSRWHPRWTHR